MTPLEEYTLAAHWYDRIRVMALYHYYCLANEQQWSIAHTAEYFGISKSLVAENLMIAKHLEEVKGIGSRNKALKRLRGIKVND